MRSKTGDSGAEIVGGTGLFEIGGYSVEFVAEAAGLWPLIALAIRV